MPCALIITAAGINCDLELGRAFELAGAQPEFIHLNRLMKEPELLRRFDLIGLPGGFSYGDAIAAGRIAAQLMKRTLYRAFVDAINRGTPIIAPCNGFQIAVQMGLLPGPEIHGGETWPDEAPAPTLALAQNQSGRFVDRWCQVEIPSSTRCIWTQNLECQPSTCLLPIAHGEGRLVAGSDSVIDTLEQRGQIAVRYAAPDNPNGSVGHIAGVCDGSGLVFGLMPHPERFTQWNHHPAWTSLDPSSMLHEPLGLLMFRNAVRHVRERSQVGVATSVH